MRRNRTLRFELLGGYGWDVIGKWVTM